ncbi:MAG: aminotransferase class I/II-fold pyridoxal phosphate-dependent enzyme [Candidatus Magasanikbacteria bacterium]|nr:aminotransferase class I/II-fold pyridoxal phosphate-dependent enzyme [Candidatus Magasanikbacteria bacterium]
MKIFRKPIFTGFAPNLAKSDAWIAASFLLFPWKWFQLKIGKNAVRAEQWLKNYFSVKHCFVFDSGRSALYFILKSLDLKPGEEVLLQSYTCVVVANAIIQAGGKPVYVDIGDDFNMDLADLEKKITPQAKVLLIQHTFGKPANLDLLLKLAKKYNLFIIEDCAHALGIKYNGKLLGTFGDVGFFSFGSDKPVSCGRGGAVVTNDDGFAEKLFEFQRTLPSAKLGKVLQHLFSFIIFFISKPVYNLGVGKCLLWCAGRLGLINKIIYPKEKRGRAVKFYPSLLVNSLATILLNQLRQLDVFNNHRREIARRYQEKIENKKIHLPNQEWGDVTWLRYPILIAEPERLLASAKKDGIILGNWYDVPVAPKDADSSVVGYQPGTCPKAERLASQSINLPTDISISFKDAEKIIKLINYF